MTHVRSGKGASRQQKRTQDTDNKKTSPAVPAATQVSVWPEDGCPALSTGKATTRSDGWQSSAHLSPRPHNEGTHTGTTARAPTPRLTGFPPASGGGPRRHRALIHGGAQTRGNSLDGLIQQRGHQVPRDMLQSRCGAGGQGGCQAGSHTPAAGGPWEVPLRDRHTHSPGPTPQLALPSHF